MVDKALIARAPMLVGISAPTSLAIDHARVHGLTLLALARSWDVDAPIADQVDAVVAGRTTPVDMMDAFINRDPKAETD